MKNVYETIKKRSLPIIESYENDLLITDKELIKCNPGIPFIHFTGSTGTHIEFLFPHDSEVYPPEGETIPYLFFTADREHMLREKRNILPAIRQGNRTALILYYNGKKVKKITIDECDFILRIYVSDVLKAWERK